MARTEKYDGFISYSHAVDGKLAPALQQALHALAKPWYRIRALHIFRDETSLAANPALWSSIEKALASSKWFIYLASPKAAASEWVQREIDWWLSHREPSSMLVALTDGTLQWDHHGGRFDWNGTNAFPRDLAAKFSEEPLWVDLSWARGIENLNLRHSQFRAAVLRLASPIHGRPPDELDGDDVREHRRNRRTAQAAVAALVVLLAASLLAAYLAIGQNQESMSRELAAYSLQQIETDPELSLTLALHAIDRARTQQAEEALRRALAESKVIRTTRTSGPLTIAKFSPPGTAIILVGDPEVALYDPDFGSKRTLPHPSRVTLARFSADGSQLATAAFDGYVRLWDVASGTLRGSIEASMKKLDPTYPSRRLDELAISADGQRIVTVGGDRLDNNDSAVARVWDVRTAAMISELRGHTRWIKGVAFDRAGKLVATGSVDNSVRVWSADSGSPLMVAREVTRETFALAFTDDGSSLVGACEDGAVLTWPVPYGSTPKATRIHDVEKNGGVSGRRAWLSPSGKRAVVRSPTATTVYDPIARRTLHELLEFPTSCSEIVFSPTERLAACPGTDGTATLWEVDTGQKIAQFRGHIGAVTHLDFSADEHRLISAGMDGTARLWNVELSTDAVLLGGYDSEVERATWSSDGQLVATGSFGGIVRVWDTHGGSLVSQLNAGGRIKSLAFTKDDKRLLVGSLGENGLQIVDSRSGADVETLTLVDANVAGSAQFSRDGSVVFAAILEKAVKPAPRTPNPLATRPPGTSSSNQGLLAGLLLRRRLARWDAASYRSLEALEAGRGLSLGVMTNTDFFAFSQSAGLVFLPTEADDTSRLWDIESGRLVTELRGHMTSVTDSAMSPDGNFVALSDQEQVELWHVRSGLLKHTLRSPFAKPTPEARDPESRIKNFKDGRFWFSTLAFDPTSSRLATGGSEAIARVWDISSGRIVRELAGHTNSLTAVRFSPDGRLLVTAGQDARAIVWQLDDGQRIATLSGHRDAVVDARFSADSRRVLTIGADGTARIFDVSSAKPLTELLIMARQRQTRPLSAGETHRFIH